MEVLVACLSATVGGVMGALVTQVFAGRRDATTRAREASLRVTEALNATTTQLAVVHNTLANLRRELDEIEVELRHERNRT